MSKTILVTGGTGYIGSCVVYELIKKGYQVVVIDNQYNSFKENLNEKANYYFAAFNDRKVLDEIHKEHKIDLVMHFAGSIYVGESMSMPNEYMNNNSHSTEELVYWMKDNNINNIVFSSTAAVYGNPEVVPISEDSKLDPINPYGKSKLWAEKIIQDSNLKYVIFRYFNVAGAIDTLEVGYNTRKPAMHIIPIICETFKGVRKEFTIFGNDFDTKDKTAVRDYVHVQDLAQAHIMGAEHLLENKSSDIFNLGSNSGYSNKEVVDIAQEVIGEKLNYSFGPRRLGDPAKLVAANTKVKKVLGWEPKRDLKKMIESQWKWLNKNQK